MKGGNELKRGRGREGGGRRGGGRGRQSGRVEKSTGKRKRTIPLHTLPKLIKSLLERNTHRLLS